MMATPGIAVGRGAYTWKYALICSDSVRILPITNVVGVKP